MRLVSCLKSSETALICDFAEIYHVIDWRSLPTRTAAALAAGLPDDSRSVMKLAGMKIKPGIGLTAAILDRVSFLAWTKTKDGQKNRNRPASILEIMTGEKRESENETFTSADEFERRRAEILKGG